MASSIGGSVAIGGWGPKYNDGRFVPHGITYQATVRPDSALEEDAPVNYVNQDLLLLLLLS